MSGKSINFDNNKIKKSNFYRNKKIFKIDDLEILVSKKEPYGKKNSLEYFIGYNDNGVIRPLYIKLPQMVGWLGMLNVLIVIRQCLLRLLIISY